MKFIFSVSCAHCGALNEVNFDKSLIKKIYIHESYINDDLEYRCKICEKYNELEISIESVKGGGDD